MNKTLSVTLALVAGLLGGLLTRYIAPPAAFAQNQAPVTTEIRAQSFTLVDPADRTVGTFRVEGVPGSDWNRRIVLRDSNGHEIWSAGESAIRPVSQR